MSSWMPQSWRRKSRRISPSRLRGPRDGAARSLSGEKAQRIIDAMRRSVARRGTAGSTFDHVSREAGVSRGLLHYYFGTKEQLLVEAVRRDCELRLERLERQLSTAKTAEDFIDLMAQNLQETVREDPDFVTLVFELFTLSRRNEDIARRVRGPDAAHARAGRGDARGRRRARAFCGCTPSRRRSRRSCSRSATGSRCGCSASPTATSRRRSARASCAYARCSPIDDSYNRLLMPIYEYRRPDGTTFEMQQSFSDDALTVDPETGVPVERVLHAPAVHFKGKGFYNTDYGTRNRQRETAAAAEKSASRSPRHLRSRPRRSPQGTRAPPPTAPAPPPRPPLPGARARRPRRRTRTQSLSRPRAELRLAFRFSAAHEARDRRAARAFGDGQAGAAAGKRDAFRSA